MKVSKVSVIVIAIVLLAGVLYVIFIQDTAEQSTNADGGKSSSEIILEDLNVTDSYLISNSELIVYKNAKQEITYTKVQGNNTEYIFINNSDIGNLVFFNGVWYKNLSNYESYLSNSSMIENIKSIIIDRPDLVTFEVIKCHEDSDGCIRATSKDRFSITTMKSIGNIVALKYLGETYTIDYNQTVEILTPNKFQELVTDDQAREVYTSLCNELVEINKYYICNTFIANINQ